MGYTGLNGINGLNRLVSLALFKYGVREGESKSSLALIGIEQVQPPILEEEQGG
jgi:hypothetical protein